MYVPTALSILSTTAGIVVSLATVWLAAQTRRAARAADRTAKATNRMASDAVCPYLVMEPVGGATIASRVSLLSLSKDQPQPVFTIHCAVRNLGRGPAMNVRMTLLLPCSGVVGRGPSRQLSPVPADGEMYCADGSLLLPLDRLGIGDAEGVHGDAWQMLLEYKDVSGEDRYAVHTPDPMSSWVVFGTGKVDLSKAIAELAQRRQHAATPRAPVTPLE